MKKFAAIFLILALLFLLPACGAAKSDSAANEIMAAESAAPMVEPRAAADEEMGAWDGADMAAGKGKVAQQDAKIIYTADLSMQTLTFEEAVEDITAAVESAAGYFAESSISGQGSGYRYAHYTARIPVENFEDFITTMGEVCHVTYSSTSAQDISDVYYDTDSRLVTAKTKLARLQELLAQADNMADIITIESAITDTEWQIENLSGTLRGYDDQVDYATVYMDLNEVYKLSGTENSPITLGQRISQSFAQGFRSVGQALENLLVWLAGSWIWLIVIAAAVFGGVKLGKKIRHKRLKKGEV